LLCYHGVVYKKIFSYIALTSSQEKLLTMQNDMRKLFKQNTLTGVLIVLVFSSYTSAQNHSLANAPIKVTIIKGLNINLVNGDLDFGELVQSGISTKVTKTPDKGIYLEVNGHPGHDVVIDYNNTTLSNKPWSDSYGGTEGNLLFQPDVEYSNSEPDYLHTNPVVGGNSYSLSNSIDKTNLHLWIGGEIDIPQNQPSGDYSGHFVVTVSY
jgi:hypothetical protein